MGLISALGRLLFARGGVTSLSQAGVDLVGAFRPNANRQMELGHDAFIAVQNASAAEFRSARGGWFDQVVNGLNRLPRPMLALGTLGLFVYAMVDPDGFSRRMTGLASVPDPLWWLLGAIVAFYFGARETHYLRGARMMMANAAQVPHSGAPGSSDFALPASALPATGAMQTGARSSTPATTPAATAPSNPALADWRASREDLDP